MHHNPVLLAIIFGVVFHVCMFEAKSLASSNSVEIMLNILLGGRGTRQGGSETGTAGSGEIEQRIQETLAALQQHVESISANMSSLEQLDSTLQRIQDMAEDTNTVQQSIIEYLGIEDEVTTARPIPTENPETGNCESDQFSCDNGNCIREGWRCDGDNDCGDGSDEADEICSPSCSYDQFTCNNGDCISDSYVCDGDNDCSDMSDENEYACPHLHTDAPTPPPVLTGEEEIYLNEDDSSVRIQHPANGGEYRSNERFHWIVRNEDPNAVGFRVDVESVSVENCCDKILISRDDCHFDTRILYTSDGPIFSPGPVLNVTFTSDGSVNYNGFMIQVFAIYSLDDSPCPGNKREVVLHQNQTTTEIRHPENSGEYDDNEQYLWIIRNENSGAMGFEISFDQMEIETCCDKLRIEGEYCSYGKHTYLETSSVTVRGDQMNVSWTSDHSNTRTGFVLGITSLQELNTTDCYEYTCDDAGRCLRVHNDDLLTWNDSVAACEAEGARLAVITDEETSELVKSLLNEQYLYPWIGMYGYSEGDLTWVNGVSIYEQEYEDWNMDFSSDTDGLKCGYVTKEGWEYTDCSYKRYYACQRL